MTHATCDRYSVVTSSANMPRSCKGTYRRIGLVLHDHDVTPERIANTATSSVESTWERLHVGRKTGIYWDTLEEALALCDAKNADLQARYGDGVPA